MRRRTREAVAPRYRQIDVVITKKELEQFGLRKVRRKIYKFQQQHFSHFMRLSSAFRRYNGVKLLAALGSLLMLIGCIILFFTRTFSVEIPYSEGMSSVDFQVARDVDGPFFVYAYITNFRAHFRRWMQSRPHYYSHNCGEYDSVDSALYVRPLESFPEVAHLNPHDPLIPCGLTSITYFNDEFELQAWTGCANHTCPARSVTISGTAISPKELFSLYARPVPEDQKQFQWINPLRETRFQTWQYSSFASHFPILIGTIRDYTLYRGRHRLGISLNVWPARRFDATKRIVIMNMGAMGTHQDFLGALCIGWGAMLILIGLLFLWGMRRNIVFASHSMMGISSEELRQQWITHAQEWLLKEGRQDILPMAIALRG